MNVPVYELHGVASFYPHFRLKPPPKTTIHVCTDLPCHLRNAGGLLERLKALAGDKARGDTPQVEVKGCSCLGQCDGAPAVMINDNPYARKTADEIVKLADLTMTGLEIPHQHFDSPKGPFKTDPYSGGERYGALRQLVASGEYAAVIEKIKAANLRGMGGGGFAAHIKWNTVRNQNSEKKYIVCNGDESEVGTFKDREILKLLPHLLVEAMTIAGLVTGATKGYIYIRHEYHEQINILEKELAEARTANLVGDNILGSGKNFDLQVFVSPGGYVQGEETALLEAIEGKRGQPRNKPIDLGLAGIPAMNGLWGKPTLINNVETYIYVPVILLKGPEWFVSQGVNGSQGLKWIGVGGHVNKPGVFEVPMGTRYSEALALAGGVLGGRKLKAFAPSGPSFGFLPAAAVEAAMDFPQYDKEGKPANEIAKVGGTVGSAAIVMFAEGTDMVDAALNFTKFYRNESCGKCVPCRVGSQKMVDIIAGIAAGTARDNDLEEIERLGETMVMTSICGLGQVVAKPIQSVLKHFRGEIEAMVDRKVTASGNLPRASLAEIENRV
jgi:NADH:ubiquinone oxidoreductase subunit F (NADH-binding)